MMNSRPSYPFLFITLFCVTASFAQTHYSIDLMSGYVFNLRSPLLIQEQGKDNQVLMVDYKTESLSGLPYFLLRFNFHFADRALEIQFLHHKITVTSPQGPVQQFEINHGFNILSFHYRLRMDFLNLRFGAGAIIAYPESIVSGHSFSGSGGLFDSGYYLAGPAILVGANKAFTLSEKLYLNTEILFTTAWALVPTATGQGFASNFAVHFLLGGGYQF
jgi:hypothetical protein